MNRVRGSWPRLRRAACRRRRRRSSTPGPAAASARWRSASRPALRAVASLRAASAAATACWAESDLFGDRFGLDGFAVQPGFERSGLGLQPGPGPPRPRSPAVARAPDPGRYGRGGAGLSSAQLRQAPLLGFEQMQRAVQPLDLLGSLGRRLAQRRQTGLDLVPRRPRRFGTCQLSWRPAPRPRPAGPRPAAAGPSGRANGDRARAPRPAGSARTGADSARHGALLLLQAFDLGGQRLGDVAEPDQIGLGRRQPELGLVPPGVQPADAGGFLEDLAPLGRLGIDQPADLALADERRRTRPGSGVGEEQLDIAGALLAGIDPICGALAAIDAAFDLDLVAVVGDRPAPCARYCRARGWTEAMLRAGRVVVPPKMTSSISPPRSRRAEDSPITHCSASTRFDLPHPFGPTMPVSPGSIRSSVGSTRVNPVDRLGELQIATAPPSGTPGRPFPNSRTDDGGGTAPSPNPLPPRGERAFNSAPSSPSPLVGEGQGEGQKEDQVSEFASIFPLSFELPVGRSSLAACRLKAGITSRAIALCRLAPAGAARDDHPTDQFLVHPIALG